MKNLRFLVLFGAGLLGFTGLAQAQAVSPQALAGEWAGSLGGALPLVLHVSVDASGGLTATMDSPTQGANGLAGAHAKLSGMTFSFELPLLKGEYTGTVSADGKTMSGTWTQEAMQGQSEPLEWKQTKTESQVAAEMAKVKPSPIDGDWNGALSADGQSLRLVFHFHAAPDGIAGSLDSLDQNTMGIPCGSVKLDGRKVSVDVPAVKGTYDGTLGADGKTMRGTWLQGAPLELDLTRAEK
jgi:hypothetical protein